MKQKRFNFVLCGFILVSSAVHVLVFLHLAGVYESRAISYIEMTLQGTAKPAVRNIPRPRQQLKPPEITNTQKVVVQQFFLPKDIRIEPVAAHDPDSSCEKIHLPDLPDKMNVSGFAVSGLKIASQALASALPSGQENIEYTSAKEYFEMMTLRIDRFKNYPESAKSRYIQGRVKVSFVLNKDGSLSDIKIAKTSRHKNLDHAALEAVKKASPFPRPPAFIFKPPVMLQISILFELA